MNAEIKNLQLLKKKRDEVLKGFIAYSSRAQLVVNTITAALTSFREKYDEPEFLSWEENDIAGKFIRTGVLGRVSESDVLIADISVLNFNVTYEIGFAIAQKKRLFLIRHGAITYNSKELRTIGIFDTLGWKTYENAAELQNILLKLEDMSPIEFDPYKTNTKAPVYLLSTQHKTDSTLRIIGRLKKAGLNFRSFDPQEQGRLSAIEAVENVASSIGVVLPLLPKQIKDSHSHNLRASFLGGLADGMEKLSLMLQTGDDPVPIDFRDFVKSYAYPEDIDPHIASFASSITTALQKGTEPVVTKPKTFLAQLNLGASAAENEMQDLASYYVETDEFNRAVRGEVRLVVGRKGSGKTAVFVLVRDEMRAHGKLVVLDLKPEGYQLLKFRDQILDLMEEGTKEHTLTAFWEYVLLLEICHKIIDEDKKLHLRDTRLYEPYRALVGLYDSGTYLTEGDFSERIKTLIDGFTQDFKAEYGGTQGISLGQDQLTELLYRHDVGELRRQTCDYLGFKDGVWILFDNLDKGWPAQGVETQDVQILRCLLDASRKLERFYRKNEVECITLIFIRNDVYQLLLEGTPDRGKEAVIQVDWSDAEMLREILRRRLVFNGLPGDTLFPKIWRDICESHINGEESSQYLIERSLMRPRCLIDLVNACRSHAVNLQKNRIEVEDILVGEEQYSTNLVAEIGLELRDVNPLGEDILYDLLGLEQQVREENLLELMSSRKLEKEETSRLFYLLLWYGILGFVRETDKVAYIYNVNYDMKRLLTLIEQQRKKDGTHVLFSVNPAFWKGLEIQLKDARQLELPAEDSN